MIEWLESYLKENITLWLRTTAFPRACVMNYWIRQRKNIPIQKTTLNGEKRTIASENASVDKASFVKELEWMRRQPKQEQRNLNPSRRFLWYQGKAQSRRKENKVELEINGRTELQNIELQNLI
jgi:hypothetical protein